MLSGPSCPGANRSKVIGQSLAIEVKCKSESQKES